MTITYKQFGQHLLESFDLDPLYPILVQSGMGEGQISRWLLAYWVYYSAGVASRLSEVKVPHKYYNMMMVGDSERWPRGHERRHMRGDTIRKTVAGLVDFGAPEQVVGHMTHGGTFDSHTHIVTEFYGFGQWIAFKIYDMMDRVLCLPVDISNVNLYIYRDPVKGAALYKFKDQTHPITIDELGDVIQSLLDMFSGYQAPPYNDRPLSAMEIETILCKAKSNYNGHYPLGNDAIDIYHGLQGWGDTAQALSQLLAPYYDMWKDMPYEDRNVRIEV